MFGFRWVIIGLGGGGVREFKICLGVSLEFTACLGLV